MAETNYDRLQNRTVDEMADYIYHRDDELNDEICKTMQIDNECPHGDDVTSEDCIACIKRWLESEAAE